MKTTKYEIWEPRYHDDTVLLAASRVGDVNLITFTRAGHLNGEYRIRGEEVRQCKLTSNGSIPCYAVPMAWLTKVVATAKLEEQDTLF